MAHAIGVAITCNNHLQEFIISESELQTPGAVRIAGSLQKLSTLTNTLIIAMSLVRQQDILELLFSITFSYKNLTLVKIIYKQEVL